MRRCDRWDYSITSNPHSTEVWDRGLPVPLHHPRVRLPAQRPARRWPPRADRDGPARWACPGPRRSCCTRRPTASTCAGFQPLLDLDELADALGPDTVLLVRAHYFYGRPPGRQRPRRARRLRLPERRGPLLAADVLVTDYSSLMFDYAVLDRPIVVFAPDWDAYCAPAGSPSTCWPSRRARWPPPTADLVDAFRTGESGATRRPRQGTSSGPGSATRRRSPPSGWSGGSSLTPLTLTPLTLTPLARTPISKGST